MFSNETFQEFKQYKSSDELITKLESDEERKNIIVYESWMYNKNGMNAKQAMT